MPTYQDAFMREGQAGSSSTLSGALSVQNRRQPRGLHRLPGPPGSDRKDRLAARSEGFHADPPAGTPSPDARRDPLGPRRLGVSTARWEEAPRTGYLARTSKMAASARTSSSSSSSSLMEKSPASRATLLAPFADPRFTVGPIGRVLLTTRQSEPRLGEGVPLLPGYTRCDWSAGER
ncbi:unnamed protein product [Gadus morhua 'NCC']